MGLYFFETGKIAGGLFGALVLALVLTAASNRIFAPGAPARPGYVIAVANDGRSAQAPAAAASNTASAATADKPGSETGAAVVNESRSVEADAAAASSARSAESGAPAPAAAAVLSDASPAADEKKIEADGKACQGCDASEKGAVAKAGPPLFAIVDRPKSSVAGLAHSNSLRPEGANWTADDLDRFLASPHGGASVTQAAGDPDGAKRADIVEYLRALSDHPRRGRSK